MRLWSMRRVDASGLAGDSSRRVYYYICNSSNNNTCTESTSSRRTARINERGTSTLSWRVSLIRQGHWREAAAEP